MDNIDLQLLRQVVRWADDGHRVVVATVTRTWGSAPRPVGSIVALRDDGCLAGSVSGGCIEDDLIAQMRSGVLPLPQPQRLRYGVGAEAAARFGLPCGGTLELLLERVTPASGWAELLERLGRGERVRRVLSLADGRASLHPAAGGDELSLGDHELVTTHGPNWRLLLIGAGPLSQVVAQMALALDYQVLVCDPREEHRGSWSLPGARLVAGMPDDAVLALQPDAHTAVVALTHDPKLDDLALMEALNSAAFYVGAIGSRVNQARRRARLAEHFGLGEAQLARLHGPVGLDIGARTPAEIAVSVVAEMTAVRYGKVPAAVSPRVAVARG